MGLSAWRKFRRRRREARVERDVVDGGRVELHPREHALRLVHPAGEEEEELTGARRVAAAAVKPHRRVRHVDVADERERARRSVDRRHAPAVRVVAALAVGGAVLSPYCKVEGMCVRAGGAPACMMMHRIRKSGAIRVVSKDHFSLGTPVREATFSRS